MPEIIVIGAGITGLTAAYHLKRAGLDVIVLEEADKAGGKIGTERIDGFLLEAGPNSLRVENRDTLDLITAVGLSDRMISASPAAKKRFILKHGEWVQVPSGPGDALKSSLLSRNAKLRVLREPFVAPSLLDDESVASFVTRRFGPEVFHYAADPFITGIYAGDPHQLSIRHAFPALWKLERDYGSIIKGGIRKARAPKDPNKVRGGVVSFPDGLGELIEALQRQLKDSLNAHEGAVTIQRNANGYTVATSSERFTAERVIIASPAHRIARVVADLLPELSSTLEAIQYPPIGVAYLGYRQDQFATPVEGFGGLIPSSENRKVLGIIFSSSNFTGRAPEGHVLLTVLAGGARNMKVRDMSDSDVLANAKGEVDALMRPSGAPVFQRARIWKRAIPQYTVGYQSVLSALDHAEQEMPGLHFLGNYRSGVSMGSCIRNATELAKRLV